MSRPAIGAFPERTDRQPPPQAPRLAEPVQIALAARSQRVEVLLHERSVPQLPQTRKMFERTSAQQAILVSGGRGRRMEVKFDLEALRRAERRQVLAAGRAFAEACRIGDWNQIEAAAGEIGETGDWRVALKMAAALNRVPKKTKDAFHWVWINHQGIAGRAGERKTVARALRLLLPKTNLTKAMRIYRGTVSRNQRVHGFSWTKSRAVARKFAQQGSQKGGRELSWKHLRRRMRSCLFGKRTASLMRMRSLWTPIGCVR
jgi:hypothetical protein